MRSQGWGFEVKLPLKMAFGTLKNANRNGSQNCSNSPVSAAFPHRHHLVIACI